MARNESEENNRKKKTQRNGEIINGIENKSKARKRIEGEEEKLAAARSGHRRRSMALASISAKIEIKASVMAA